MKWNSILFVSILSLFFSGCEKDKTCGFAETSEENGLIDEWKLVEVLMDPGDGSGTFQPIVSNKTITFCSDGTFLANGEMCSMTDQASTSHVGDYFISTGILNPENCASTQPLNITFTWSGDTLLLYYPCFEGCAQKYYRN